MAKKFFKVFVDSERVSVYTVFMNKIQPTKKIIGFQAPVELVAKIDRLKLSQGGISRSDVCRIIIEKYFSKDSLFDEAAQ